MRHWLGAPARVARVQGRRFAAWARHRSEITLIPGALAALLLAVCLFERIRSTWRRLWRRPARVIFGPTAILNIKYWSLALRGQGYESLTLVESLPFMVAREDFDLVRDELFPRVPQRFRGYAMFAWALRHGDVFVRFFDLGFLRGTRIQWWEYPLTRLAGKKVIVTPYGGDVAVVGHLGSFEELLVADYPDLPARAEATKHAVDHTLRWADLSVRTTQLGYQPSYGAVCPHLQGIDTELWASDREPSDANGADGEVVVVHAPNHRAIKGTDNLERVIEDLRGEGLKVRLSLLEGKSNEEVRAAVKAGDIVADQFYGGYGLFAVEGMAAGKPVMSNLTMWWLPDDVRRIKEADGCPIVDTDEARLPQNLRRLVEDPAMRREAGDRGREFAVKNHSHEAVGKTWEALVAHVWNRRPLPERFVPGDPGPGEQSAGG